MKPHGYIEEFGKENVVFLTSESPNTLTGEVLDHSFKWGYNFSPSYSRISGFFYYSLSCM